MRLGKVNTSEASTRLRLVFPSQSILILTDIPLRTRWSAGSNSARVISRGRDRRCVSSFVSGHTSRAASMLIFSSFEVRAPRAQRNFQILNQLLVIVALNINEHSTDEGHSPEMSGHLLLFWHFLHHSQLLFIYCSTKCHAAYKVFNFLHVITHMQDARHPNHRVKIPYSKFSSPKTCRNDQSVHESSSKINDSSPSQTRQLKPEGH